MNLIKLLSGYKTYVVAFSIVMTGLTQISSGDWAGGLLHIVQSQEFIIILGGFGLGTLRAGVEKLLLALQGANPPQNVPTMEDFAYTDASGNAISQAEYNKAMKDLGLMPVLSLMNRPS